MTIASASERVRTRLHDRLSRETRAEVYFDRGRRGLYATDASLYQIDPLGVVVPRTVADVVQVVKIAAEEGAPVLPRGAATSLSGQTVGPAIIIDFSKYLNRIGVVDRDRMTVRVEPGVVLDTAGRASQAAGADVRARRLDQRPGDDRRDDRQQLGRGAVAAVRQDGRPRPLASMSSWPMAPRRRSVRSPTARSTPSAPGRTGSGWSTAWSATSWRSTSEAIAAKFPKILRRVSGYNLDEFVPGLAVRPVGWPEEPWQFNLARLIVGSEGTLAIVTGAELKVVPLPRRRAWWCFPSPRSPRRSTGWPRSSRPARWPSRCSTG